MNNFKFVHSRNMGALRHVLRVALFNMPNSNRFDVSIFKNLLVFWLLVHLLLVFWPSRAGPFLMRFTLLFNS